MTTEAKPYSSINGYKPKDHSNGNNHHNGDDALLETEPIVSQGLREQLSGVQIIFVSPRGAAKRPDGGWTNARYSSTEYTPVGGGPQAGALRPIAIEQLLKGGFLPNYIPIVVPSGDHPKESFTWHHLIKNELERRGIPSQQITTDDRSLDTVGEQGVLMQFCAEGGYQKVAQVTDYTQMPRQEMVNLLFQAESRNVAKKANEFVNKIINNPAMKVLANGQVIEQLIEYVQEKQGIEGMKAEVRLAELQRIRLIHEVTKDPVTFFQDLPDELKLVANAFFDFHAAKTGYNWRAAVTPDMLSQIEKYNTIIVFVPVEEIFKQTNRHLASYARRIEGSPDTLRTIVSELAGIAHTRMFLYNGSSELNNKVTQEFLNRTGTLDFLRRNRERYESTLKDKV